MGKKKLFVLSMDAMVTDDIDQLLQKPDSNFVKLFGNYSGVREMKTIYPSITYPAHVSIMTGCYPDKHGVFNNMKMTVEDTHPLWHVYRSSIKVDTIFDAAKRAGLSTAAVYWPVTGNDPNIDYLVNEFFFYENEPLEQTFIDFGANEVTMKAVRENLHLFPPVEKRNKGGNYIDFITGVVCSLIRDVNPDVILAHNCLFDTLRHAHGIFNQTITDALDKFDEELGQIMDAMRDAGTLEDTDFVLLSDHGQRNYYRKVHLNALLRRGGFLDIDENGKVRDYKAFVQSNGMSAFFFLKDKNDKKTYDEVYAYLKKLGEENLWGFHEVYTNEDTEKLYRLDGDFSFMVESDNYSYCSSAWSEPVIEDIKWGDYHYGFGTHGYSPEKGPQAIFCCHGPSFKEGVVIPKSDVVNEAPTITAVFGQTLPDADGHVLSEILK